MADAFDRPAYLEVHSGSRRAEFVEIEASDVPQLLGRGPDAYYRFEDKSISSRHARLHWDGRSLSLEDRGSTNGTFVNERPVTGLVVLDDGASIRFGEVECTYRGSGRPARAGAKRSRPVAEGAPRRSRPSAGERTPDPDAPRRSRPRPAGADVPRRSRPTADGAPRRSRPNVEGGPPRRARPAVGDADVPRSRPREESEEAFDQDLSLDDSDEHALPARGRSRPRVADAPAASPRKKVRPGREPRSRPGGEERVRSVDFAALQKDKEELQARVNDYKRQLENLARYKAEAQKGEAAIKQLEGARSDAAAAQEEIVGLLHERRAYLEWRRAADVAVERVAGLLGAAEPTLDCVEDEVRRVLRSPTPPTAPPIIDEGEHSVTDDLSLIEMPDDEDLTVGDLLQALPEAVDVDGKELSELVFDDPSGIIARAELVRTDEDDAWIEAGGPPPADPVPVPAPAPKIVQAPPPVREPSVVRSRVAPEAPIVQSPPPMPAIDEEERSRLVGILRGLDVSLEELGDYMESSWRVHEEVAAALEREQGWDFQAFVKELLRTESPEVLASNARSILQGLLGQVDELRTGVRRL